MKKTACLKTVLRFRRWSRARYAAFCSIGRVVTIGNLRKSIVEASLSKQRGEVLTAIPMQGGCDRCIAFDESGGDDEETEILLMPWWLQSMASLRLVLGAYSDSCKYNKNKKYAKAYRKRYISNPVCLFFML